MPQHRVAMYLEAKPHVLCSPHIALAEEAGRYVGLMAASELLAAGYPSTYIETLLIAEHLQGTNAAPGLVAALFGGVVHGLGDFPEMVLMKTYTPKAYALMRRFAVLPEVLFYPDIDGPSDPTTRALAARLASFLSPTEEFCAETGVIRGGGGRISSDFWRYRPASGDDAVDRFFRREVGSSDRMLCIVRAPTRAARLALVNALGLERPRPAPTIRQE